MNIADFAQWVQKNNQKAKRKALLAFLIFLVIQLLCSVLVTKEQGLLLLLAGQCLAAAAAADVGRYQWNRYLYIHRNEIISEETPVSYVLRLHAFPEREYFRFVNKKMVATEALLGIFCVLAGIWKGFAKEEGKFSWEECLIVLCFGIVCAGAPFFMGIVKEAFFVYQNQAGTRGGLNHLHQALKGIFLVVEVITAVVVGLVVVFLFWVFLGAAERPKIEETVVVYRMYPYCVSLIFMLIAFFGLFWTEVVIQWSKKRRRRIAAVIFGLFFLIGAVIQMAEMHIYTEITENQIVVRRLWEVKIYRTEDIKSFVIYNENDGIQMELVFDDKSSVKMVGSSMESNDLYEQNYYSEYNYIADYVERLKEFGAAGTIKDIEELRENVEDLDVWLQEGLEQIIRLVSETNGVDGG